MTPLLGEPSIAQRILDHIDRETTDISAASWREPVVNYRSEDRFQAELAKVFRRVPTPFCPSAALPQVGDFVARDAGQTPILAVRGPDGTVRAFRNACRHRGAQVACGAGRVKAFVCPYHAWTYALDGALRHIPHDYGFPGVSKESHGLVPVETVEHSGLVFVRQDAGLADEDPTCLPPLIPADYQLISISEQETRANWKIVAEGFLEGYHIYPTHRETFYPVQFDNLNVIEHFGRNNRVTFPYRNVQKLRGLDPAQREVGGTVTFVYHLFPNVMIATFPQRIVMAVLEPVSVELTRNVTYTLASAQSLAKDKPAVEGGIDFVNAGAREDRAVVESIQAGLASGANEVFEFGRFEGAIAHFHRNLHALIADEA